MNCGVPISDLPARHNSRPDPMGGSNDALPSRPACGRCDRSGDVGAPGAAVAAVVGRRADLSPVGSLNVGFTLLARGEFSIIIANLAQAGGLLALLQPFAALYVLILASAAPLLAKESERIYGLSARVLRRRRRRADDETVAALEEMRRPRSSG